MSENLDLVRSIFADWGRGDLSPTSGRDPEIEYVVDRRPVTGYLDGAGGDGKSVGRVRERLGGGPDARWMSTASWTASVT